MMKIMKIRTAEGDPYAWICFCKNTPVAEGFYPCNSEGEEVEPTPEEWTGGWYVCARCGRLINQKTLEVVGLRFENTLTLQERMDIFKPIYAKHKQR